MARWKLIAASLTVVLLSTILAPALFSAAGASTGCGTYSFGFEGTRLLNDGISDVSGPYPIDLPSGVYTVTLVAHDHHDSQVGVPTQSGEQYVVELDSGYRSPASTDIPDDKILTVTVFTDQHIESSSQVTVRHGGEPGINSVDVVCVGFTPEAIADPVVEQPIPDPPTVDVPPTETPVVEVPNPDAPVVGPPVETPVQDISDPITIVRKPQVAPPASVVPEVKGTVEFPPGTPQLAITGPGDHAGILLAMAAILIALGTILVRRERRITSSL
jgi:hypothetical protein